MNSFGNDKIKYPSLFKNKESLFIASTGTLLYGGSAKMISKESSNLSKKVPTANFNCFTLSKISRSLRFSSITRLAIRSFSIK